MIARNALMTVQSVKLIVIRTVPIWSSVIAMPARTRTNAVLPLKTARKAGAKGVSLE